MTDLLLFGLLIAWLISAFYVVGRDGLARKREDEQRAFQTKLIETSTGFYRDALSSLTEIRDVLRERPASASPFGLFGDLLKAGASARALGPTANPSAPWTGAVETVDGDRGLLRAAGVLWRWQPGVKSVHGPLCPSLQGAAGLAANAPHVLLYQSSGGLPAAPVIDAATLGPVGWLLCPECGATYAVPGLGVTVGAIRRAVDVAFRGRLGLPARGR
jgi:hypothetical protein